LRGGSDAMRIEGFNFQSMPLIELSGSSPRRCRMRSTNSPSRRTSCMRQRVSGTSTTSRPETMLTGRVRSINSLPTMCSHAGRRISSGGKSVRVPNPSGVRRRVEGRRRAGCSGRRDLRAGFPASAASFSRLGKILWSGSMNKVL